MKRSDLSAPMTNVLRSAFGLPITGPAGARSWAAVTKRGLTTSTGLITPEGVAMLAEAGELAEVADWELSAHLTRFAEQLGDDAAPTRRALRHESTCGKCAHHVGQDDQGRALPHNRTDNRYGTAVYCLGSLRLLMTPPNPQAIAEDLGMSVADYADAVQSGTLTGETDPGAAELAHIDGLIDAADSPEAGKAAARAYVRVFGAECADAAHRRQSPARWWTNVGNDLRALLAAVAAGPTADRVRDDRPDAFTYTHTDGTRVQHIDGSWAVDMPAATAAAIRDAAKARAEAEAAPRAYHAAAINQAVWAGQTGSAAYSAALLILHAEAADEDKARTTPGAAADDRIPFLRLDADNYLNRETGVRIRRIDGIWHVQAPGDEPHTGGNRDRVLDNIMAFAHTVVRAVRIHNATGTPAPLADPAALVPGPARLALTSAPHVTPLAEDLDLDDKIEQAGGVGNLCRAEDSAAAELLGTDPVAGLLRLVDLYALALVQETRATCDGDDARATSFGNASAARWKLISTMAGSAEALAELAEQARAAAIGCRTEVIAEAWPSRAGVWSCVRCDAGGREDSAEIARVAAERHGPLSLDSVLAPSPTVEHAADEDPELWDNVLQYESNGDGFDNTWRWHGLNGDSEPFLPGEDVAGAMLWAAAQPARGDYEAEPQRVARWIRHSHPISGVWWVAEIAPRCGTCEDRGQAACREHRAPLDAYRAA